MHKVNHTIPPIYQRAKKVFGINWDRGVIFTYGDQIYSKFDIDDFKFAHESVHIKQQIKMGKDIWWDRYFTDKDFRLSQELEAYKMEASKIKQLVGNTSLKERMLQQIAHDLSTYYGNIISYQEALDILLFEVSAEFVEIDYGQERKNN